ncbi:hypothetical protein COCON_G00157070 [Conger conger]|uniref:Coiled-coil domain-containing protein 157 n=1 Tax=Conger conger TaxID=82655 RepID=A0A9Q1D9K2_CONCO|nr:coiled-coil domain-containing protein 157 [Conger conger]KAJ8263250.1 hypothetical protein COCON_G00157070 [Conger conger]
MTNILGRQDCIDSLRKDLTDLQGAVIEVFSKTGYVRFPSWKFPDKLSCSLDMVELLDQYDFVEGDEEFSQHSHIVLLELVIDRMVLLLQSFNAHAELVLGGNRNSSRIPQTSPLGSIGLVTKRYWSNVALLCTLLQNVQQEKSKENEEASEEKAGKQVKASGKTKMHILSAPPQQNPRNNLNQRVSSVPQQSSSGAGPRVCPRVHNISTDVRTVSSQTVTSALVPCEACARVQSSMREVSDALVELCQIQGLPSSLMYFLAALDESLEQGRLSAGDVAQWAVEQRRDLGRLGKHLAKMRDTVQPLRESLVALEEAREELMKQLEEAQEQQARQRSQYQAGLQEHDVRLREAQSKKEEAAGRQHEELKKCIKSLEKKNAKLQAQIDIQSDTIHRLECVRDGLQQDVSAREEDQQAIQKLEEKIRLLEAQLLANQTLLDKESAKYQSACRQQESMQLKQKAMLEQVDTLDRECEEMQRRLGESEEAKEDLQEKMTQMLEEKNQLNDKLAEQQAQVAGVQEEKQGLQSHMEDLQRTVTQLQDEVLELTHREKLLVAYPELSALAHGPPQSTGDVFKDMEQQLLANSMRIRILEQQNATLCSSLVRLKDKAEHGDFSSASPQQLGVPSLPRAGQGNPASTIGHNAHSRVPGQGVKQQGLGDGSGLARAAETVGLWGPPSSASSLASVASSSKILHQQTLALLLPPEDDASRAYARARNTARMRNNNMAPKKK